MIVEIEVVEQKGTCVAGLKKGDKIRINPNETPCNFCAPAFVSLYPNLKAISAGAKFGWAEPDGSILAACPDPKNPIVFSLKVVE
ncbi:TIGR04076 family protein [Schnuerera ultunensis]|uniref:TIGR04076 family protein n=1 Tax=[Clostridium] ultunense Esp TaxID=1288971 RepID=A0A1M4PKL1_9FIRM|nr:TIGR04076 family protein [Schnuerera ultunensis]SHD75972.1 conserved protein of unknown function [[Clostridium] ultunense Esp]